MYITLLFDVEDIISPEADDIAREVADIVAADGLQATFCLVGERARQWRERGRSDILSALARHDIGYHTDFHSVHPTIAEYLGDKGWEEGVEEALRRESPGIEALRDVFGVTPSCWGGPGNTWGPQINEAMRRLGVPALVYAHTRVPGGDIHRFCGLLAYPDGHYMGDDRYHDTPAWEARLQQVTAALAHDRDEGRQWAQVFMGHPTRILHTEFWDSPNFSQGANPPRECWVKPRRKSDADLTAALENLRRGLHALKTLPGIEIRTIREMNALLEGNEGERLSVMEQAQVAPIIEQNLLAMGGWVILPPAFNTATIRAVTREKLDTLRRVTIAA